MFHIHGIQGRVFSGTLEQLRRLRVPGVARHHEAVAEPAMVVAIADARLAGTDMEQSLRRCSALRRATQQLHKSRRRVAGGGTP